MSKVQVVSGDIARVKADALITAINSGGKWFGGIDNVIRRVAGSLFHDQASAAAPLSHGQTVVARSNGSAHDGAFTNVVFVIDDLQSQLRDIVYNGLKAASEAGFRTVTLPTIRMGVMLGAVEKSTGEAVQEMVAGVSRFLEEDGNIESLSFVVYGDEGTQQMLANAFMVQ